MHLKPSDIPLKTDLWTTPACMESGRITDPATLPGSTEWDFDLAIALVQHQTALADHLESLDLEIHGEKENLEGSSLGYFGNAFRYLARHVKPPTDGHDSSAPDLGYQRLGDPHPEERTLERITSVLPTIHINQGSQPGRGDAQSKFKLGHGGSSPLNAEIATPGRESVENSQGSSKKLTRKRRAKGTGVFGGRERHSPYARPVKDVSIERRKVIQDLTGLSEPQQGLQAKGRPGHLASEALEPHTCGKTANGYANGLPSVSEGGARLSLSGQEKQLRIKQILYGDSPPTVEGSGSFSHFLVPSQVMPTERSIRGGIHVFVDISNILVGFYNVLKQNRGLSKETLIPRIPLSFQNLSMILERGRPVARAIVAGSDELESTEEAKELGYEVNVLKRVKKHKERPVRQQGGQAFWDGTSAESEVERLGPKRAFEQAVDEILHLKMLQSVLDTEIPSTMVIATGDAAKSEYSDGFLAEIERVLKNGWNVEVVAFRDSMSSAYRHHPWAGQWAGRFKTIQLDAYAEYLRLD